MGWSTCLSVLLLLSPAIAQEQQRGPNGVIYGVVTTSDGQPAKGLHVRASQLGTGGSGGGFNTKTNNEGEYRFQKLPLWSTYRVYADDEAAGYSRVSTGPAPGNPLSEVEITPEHPEAEFNFSLPLKAGFVQIHLTNRRTGAAISEMTVWVAPVETPDSGLFTLSAHSDYLILVPPDRNLLLHVTAEGFREWDESVGRGKPINVPSESRLTLDVQLEPLE